VVRAVGPQLLGKGFVCDEFKSIFRTHRDLPFDVGAAKPNQGY
jgi:hypothetical protein